MFYNVQRLSRVAIEQHCPLVSFSICDSVYGIANILDVKGIV